jgi:uncharacterized protein with GYD domain
MNKDLHHKEILCIFIVMNLQENIERIHEIMGGVITEDRREMVIKNMIDDIGIEKTIKMVGDYDMVATYLSDEDKVKYVKDKILKIVDAAGTNGIHLDVAGGPIRISDKDGEIHQIEWMGTNHAKVIEYWGDKKQYTNTVRPKYEDLPPQVIDIIIKRLIDNLGYYN